uniref:Chemokine interleukin-8-like domain-containing protein n=1 Tax=Astatotilapia calliptera TaxID=8154 RepID=A0AAX7VWB1_ASTCA
MVPFSIIDLSVDVQVSIKHLNSKKVHLCARILALLLPGFAVAEKHQPIGLCRPEVK